MSIKISIFVVEIVFKDKQLQKFAEDVALCRRKLGANCGNILLKRLHSLYIAVTLEDVRYLPGRFHELIGDRKGQWACDLEHPKRLIFQPSEQPIPTNKQGAYDWSAIKSVEIIEIVDYHGK
jgi:proteic killer suppression protein